MTLTELVAAFRSDIKDTVTPYLVSDADAYRYANEAVIEAARRSRMLVDSTTAAVAVVTVTASEPVVAIDPRVISIRRMRLDGEAVPLRKATVREMDEAIPGWESAPDGYPYIAIVDYESDSLYLYPPPVAGRTLSMTVTREPLTALSAGANVPELPSRYHYALIHWMRHKAYSAEDTDLFDKDRADRAEAQFAAEFGMRSSATDERFEFEHYHDIGER